LQQGAGALGEHPWGSATRFWWSIICGVFIEQQQDLGKQDSTPAAAFTADPVPSNTTNTITMNFRWIFAMFSFLGNHIYYLY
jgi:hypothetical protein